ncbi:hypothetical protein [Variovorax sp. CY25R-8]|uniref:hypothetical protein n=1 Tax=Variovorax sp. CY25R-8 TaxID=2855501 RepID=UPI0021BA933F|nr:hypothetical protein [Variovorax sp. CY25R-8]MCT8177077.1 hypothetical protein [Variovorax sp. CY25R-8]
MKPDVRVANCWPAAPRSSTIDVLAAGAAEASYGIGLGSRETLRLSPPMSVLRTFIGIAVFPFLAVIVMVIGFACAAAHAIAFPALYWWERYRERNPTPIGRKKSRAEPQG